jgi:biopolymer transport protein ExbB/TolQ
VETLFSSDFWSVQLAAIFAAWAILIPLLILVFWAGFRVSRRGGSVQTLRADKEALETRLRLACGQNTDEARLISGVQSKIVELQRSMKTRTKRSDLQSILEEAEREAYALASANRVTDHILSSKELAVRE